MHCRHKTDHFTSEKYEFGDELLRYNDQYYDDYFIMNTPVMLRTFGVCSRAPYQHIINRYSENYIFHYVLSGKGWCNGVPFEEGDIIFCTNNEPYNFSSNKNSPCVYAWVTFKGGKSDKYVQALGLPNQMCIYKARHPEPIHEIFSDMIYRAHQDVDTELYMESCLLHLLSLSVPQTKTADEKRSVKRITATIKYISEHYRSPELNVGEIADAVQTSEKYLRRIFKQETGISIWEYVTKTRLDAAVQLLKDSNYNINEITQYIGYSDHRNFAAMFKKRFGITPSKYTETE